MPKLLLCLLLFGTAMPVSAMPIFYSNETDFLSAVETTHFDSFEGDATVSFATMLSTDFFTVETQPLDGGTSYIVLDDSGGSLESLHATDGLSYLNFGSLTNDSWLLTYTLDFAVSAIGFTLTDPSERLTAAGLPSEVLFQTGAGESAQISACPPCLPTGSEVFFGFSSPDAPFDSFSVLNTAFSDGIGFDAFYFRAVSVPEPSALALLAIGLFGMVSVASSSSSCYRQLVQAGDFEKAHRISGEE